MPTYDPNQLTTAPQARLAYLPAQMAWTLHLVRGPWDFRQIATWDHAMKGEPLSIRWAPLDPDTGKVRQPESADTPAYGAPGLLLSEDVARLIQDALNQELGADPERQAILDERDALAADLREAQARIQELEAAVVAAERDGLEAVALSKDETLEAVREHLADERRRMEFYETRPRTISLPAPEPRDRADSRQWLRPGASGSGERSNAEG